MTLTKPAAIDAALDALTDTSLSIEDRAAAYGLWHQVQLRINRRLKAVKDDIIVFMEANGLKSLGPLSVKYTAFDVKWPVNDPGNWSDSTVQEFLRTVVDPISPEFVRHVPEHLEIDTLALGEAVHMGDPVARQLHADLKAMRLRTEEGKRLSLAVTEVKEGKAA